MALNFHCWKFATHIENRIRCHQSGVYGTQNIYLRAKEKERGFVASLREFNRSIALLGSSITPRRNQFQLYERMALSPCNNSVFQWTYTVSNTENSILVAYSAALIPTTVVANILVVYTIVKTRQVKQGVNDTFICLSVSDTLIAALSETGMIVLLTAYRHQRNCFLELWIQYSSSFLCNLSGMIILSIAIDRYIQTQRTIKMKFDRSKKWSRYLMATSMFVALIGVILDILGTFMSDYSWINMAIQVAQFIAIMSVCLLYIMTYCTVSKNRRDQSKVLAVTGLYQHSRSNVPYIRAMIVTTSMILASLLVCYFPLLIIGIITALKSTSNTNAATPRTFWNYLSFQLGFTSSLLSALVFLYRNKPCRTQVKQMLCRESSGREDLATRTFAVRYFRSTKINDSSLFKPNA